MAEVLESMQRIYEQVKLANIRLLQLNGRMRSMEKQVASAEKQSRLLRRV